MAVKRPNDHKKPNGHKRPNGHKIPKFSILSFQKYTKVGISGMKIYM
jgi:hypothetical protein